MNIFDFTREIQSMSTSELNAVVDAVKRRRTMLAKSAARTIRRGDSVSFAGRGGETIRGTVLKVNPKTVIVSSSSDATRWRVTASMLSVC
jgi:hypothetical protein